MALGLLKGQIELLSKEAVVIQVLSEAKRGRTNLGWLDSKHSFSFGDFYSPTQMGFGPLRVINDDRVEPGMGFGTHPHRDMEILSYVLEGSIAHKDSMGNGSTIRAGDVQRMSAGTGVLHSEFNPSKTGGLHFLQIWIVPEAQGIEPGYEQKHFDDSELSGKLRLVASHDGREGSVKVHQDVSLYVGKLNGGERVELPISKEHRAWVQVARGAVSLNGTALKEGDGAAISAETALALSASDAAEVLVFDLGRA